MHASECAWARSFQKKGVNTNNLQKAGPCIPEHPSLNGLCLCLGINVMLCFMQRDLFLCAFETQIESTHHTNLISLINSMFILSI